MPVFTAIEAIMEDRNIVTTGKIPSEPTVEAVKTVELGIIADLFLDSTLDYWSYFAISIFKGRWPSHK